MVFNQIEHKPVCSAKSYIHMYLVFLFSDKEATGRMVSHNKEADETVKTQHFPAGKIHVTSISNKISDSEQKRGRSWLYCLHTDFGNSRN